jgi:peptidoglycan/xylan/chitin deacetylase (PgdA/CDA1 family)
MREILVTTSWDDGHPLDLRVAELLARYGMTGTFFVPICDPYRPRLSDVQLRELSSSGFEIGSHGMLHRNLARTPRADLRWEIADSKTELEQIIGRRVSTFCYPMGRFDANVVAEVKRAGYDGARTTRMLSTRARFDPLHIPTTIQAYRHSSQAYWKNLLRHAGARDLLGYCTSLRNSESWIELGKRLFDRVLEEGGVWHLYGHSWEIEQYGLWKEFAEMLAYASGRQGVRYVRTVDTLNVSGAECLPQLA